MEISHNILDYILSDIGGGTRLHPMSGSSPNCLEGWKLRKCQKKDTSLKKAFLGEAWKGP
jgi:hypothetical protein